MHLRLVSLCLVALFAACSPENAQVASRFVKSVPVVASQGATITVSPAEEASLGNAQLVIPAGALSKDTTVTLDVGEDHITRGNAGAVAVWRPSGLTFSKPARLTLPYALTAGQRDEDVFVKVREDDGTEFVLRGAALSIDRARGLVSFNITGFTSFQPGTAALQSDGGVLSCVTDDVCAAGQDCVNGACQASHDGGTLAQCAVDADCFASQHCSGSGYCEDSPDDHSYDACSSNADCSGDDQCLSGWCQSVHAVDGGSAGGACVTDDACADGYDCISGTCQPKP